MQRWLDQNATSRSTNGVSVATPVAEHGAPFGRQDGLEPAPRLGDGGPVPTAPGVLLRARGFRHVLVCGERRAREPRVRRTQLRIQPSARVGEGRALTNACPDTEPVERSQRDIHGSVLHSR